MEGNRIIISIPFNFLCFIVFIVFLILKLTGVIHWSWMYVTMPIWLPIGLVVVIFLIALIIGMIKEAIDCRRNK